ncbi:hypothetical protein J6590_027268 [Homalodisca vitripennis]|nr:hypothetical protein J6590_027268 [Homalodisca vitripennis]
MFQHMQDPTLITETAQCADETHELGSGSEEFPVGRTQTRDTTFSSRRDTSAFSSLLYLTELRSVCYVLAKSFVTDVFKDVYVSDIWYGVSSEEFLPRRVFKGIQDAKVSLRD